MAATSEPAEVAPGTTSFELERFERSDGRLELSGRWFGVRGMRFVRPTLTLRTDLGSLRALADLEHKPWQPEDGESWQAAFPCADGVEVLGAELAVSTGIVVALPAPGGEVSDAGPIPALTNGGRTGTEPVDAGPADGPVAEPTESRDPPRSAKARRRTVDRELSTLHAETERLRREPVRLQGELDRSEQLRKDVEGELERLKLDADGAVARRDAAVDRFEDATATRDEALQAQTQALAERDQARAELRAAIADRERVAADRARAGVERDRAVSERDRAVAERDQALAERDRAVAERDRAVSERDRALAERDRARSQRAAASTQRAAPVMRGVPHPRRLDDERTRLVQRAVAIAVLFIAGLALLIVAGVL